MKNLKRQSNDIFFSNLNFIIVLLLLYIYEILLLVLYINRIALFSRHLRLFFFSLLWSNGKDVKRSLLWRMREKYPEQVAKCFFFRNVVEQMENKMNERKMEKRTIRKRYYISGFDMYFCSNNGKWQHEAAKKEINWKRCSTRKIKIL